MTTPVAINTIEELRRRVLAGHHDYAILLAGGGLRSSKSINLNPCVLHASGAPAGVAYVPCLADQSCTWDVFNDIDDSEQEDLTDRDLWTETHIGEALDKNALIDYDGDLPDPNAIPLLEGPIEGRGEVFDAFEVHDVAEYPDPHGGTFMEPLDGAQDNWQDEAVGRVVTLYGHFPSGGVHAIADAVVGEEFTVAQARDYIFRLAGSIAAGRPIHDETIGDKP